MKTILAALIFTLPLFAADAKPPTDMLNRWVGGKWVSDAHFLDTEYSKAREGSSATTCAWSPEHVFVVCDQAVTDNGEAMLFLSVYGFDPKAGTYHFYGLSPEGGRPRVGDLTISADGTHWEYMMKTEIENKAVWFRTTNQFKGNDQVDWWSEYSTDAGQHWTKTGGGLEKREK